MQTFLPHPDFGASARVLDAARLGKQRPEALQALRALVLPVYGWSRHPVARMWRGYVPALTCYTLTVIDEWTARGNRDSIRGAVLEFAPEVATVPQDALPMPPWLGDEQFHRSHRSNLVRKFPEHYEPLFPGVPNDLDYLWPEPEFDAGVDSPPGGSAPTIAVVRARTVEQAREWVATGVVTMPERSPSGRTSAAWSAQVTGFAALRPGDRIAVARAEERRLPAGIVLGEPTPYRAGDDEGLRVSVEFDGEIARDDMAHPVLLQDPRVFFTTAGPAVPDGT